MFQRLPLNELTRVQHSFAYSDGFGREIQKKIQAEPGPLTEGEPDVDQRWVGSGWTIFNNKGKPVRQYEPFFSATHQFEFARTVGVSPVLFYDAVERIVATLHPNHTWEKTVFNPWQQESWDEIDTILIADPADDIHVGAYFDRIDDTEYLPTWHQARIDGALGNRGTELGAEISSSCEYTCGRLLRSAGPQVPEHCRQRPGRPVSDPHRAGYTKQDPAHYRSSQ